MNNFFIRVKFVQFVVKKNLFTIHVSQFTKF